MSSWLAHTHTHTPRAVDSRALSPITAEHGSAAWWEQTIWGICQVLVDSKQSTVKNALPWLGSLLPAPLCSACGGRYNPPSPRRNPSSSFHIVLFFAPTDCRRLRVCWPPIWAAAADLPARLERGPRHPGDWVHSHYPLRETLRGGPGTGEREGDGGRGADEGGQGGRKWKRKCLCLHACEQRVVELSKVKGLWKVSERARVSREFSDANMLHVSPEVKMTGLMLIQVITRLLNSYIVILQGDVWLIHYCPVISLLR